MIPNQLRSVDPFSSYHSDNVNRITRSITNGGDVICRDDHLVPSKYNSTTIKITTGICIKDDVVIQITEDAYVDITDVDNFVEGSIFPNTPGSAWIVLSYQYVKTAVPPRAEFLILKDIDSFDDELFIFIGKVNYTDSATIDSIEQEDTDQQQQRQTLEFFSGYNDARARAADSENPITNHKAEVSSSNRGKLVATDATTGEVELVSKAGVPYEFTEDDYSDGVITLTHNLDGKPNVTIIDYDTAEQIFAANIVHISDNILTITFETDAGVSVTPHIYVTL